MGSDHGKSSDLNEIGIGNGKITDLRSDLRESKIAPKNFADCDILTLRHTESKPLLSGRVSTT